MISLKKRKIKEVASWSGSASNYSTPEAFAKASLMNFNTGSPDTWTKSLIKLPVRNEGDSKDVYIKQAVQAAAGGRGITRVTKPTNVSQEEFNTKRKTAANEIINAYRQWGGIAPDSVYEIAGKNPPQERAIGFSEIYDEVFGLVQLSDLAEGTHTMLYDLYYEENADQIYALGIRDGIVSKIEVFASNSGVQLGEFMPLTPENIFVESAKNSRFKVERTKNNEMRWLAIASVAFLNRVGEIDSTELFDSFIRYAVKSGNYPVLNVYHLGKGSEIGKADWLGRKGFVYMATGTFNDDEYGRAFFEALQGRSDWGNSIEFYSPKAYIENFRIAGTEIQVPIYKNGINTGITILPEKDAASVFTMHKTQSKRR